MKLLSLIFLISAALGCGNTSENSTQRESAEVTADATITSEEQETMLTGKISKEDLQSEPYKSWFSENYQAYEPAEEPLETVSKNINDYEIEVYMGTWCQDSRREVPKFFKLLEEAGYNLDNLTVYGVDRNKVLPDGTEVSTDFEMVPTIVFYKNGEEVNRFVEFPQETLEKDVAKIVSGAEYKNPYAE